MNHLNESELLKINGGGAGFVIVGFIAFATLIVGIFDGLTRPFACHE